MACHSMWKLSVLFGVAAVASSTTLAAAEKPAPTYHKDVVRILQKNCQDCHRPNQVAPFSLLTYEQARKRASDLAHVTGERIMPPWPASSSFGGPFRDARVLTGDEIATLQSWVDSNCPEGDPKDAPEPRTFSSDWALGEPDVILTMPEPYHLAATGSDDFRVFVLKTNFPEDRWIRAVDFHPGNRSVVHHIKDFTFTAVLPDGKTRVPLIKIDHWNFNWQGTYAFKQPIRIPKGSWFEVEAHFDNSDANPANQNKPPKVVRWGEGTNDEMCIGIFEWVVLEGQPEPRAQARRALSRCPSREIQETRVVSGHTPHDRNGFLVTRPATAAPASV